MNLPSKKNFFLNFTYCNNWEEKYLYIIELGENLPSFPNCMKKKEYLISECQNKVWIIINSNSNGKIELKGDSDSSIVKGLIAIVFIFYQNLTISEAINLDIRKTLKQLSIFEHLTPIRSNGLYSILKSVRSQIISLEKQGENLSGF